MAPLLQRQAAMPLGHSPYYTLICWEVLFPAVATITVALRIYLRHRFGIALGWDDLTIVLAIPFAWASWATFYCIYGNISPPGINYLRPEDGPLFSKVIFTNIEVSVTAVNLVKFSIILFFMRAFGTTRNARIALWVLLAVNVLYGLVRCFVIFIYCTPISDFWDHPAACRGNQYVYWISISLIGVVLEFVMLLFPLPFIWKLHQPRVRRLGLSALFAVAGGVVLACALRVWYFFQATDFTQVANSDRSASVLHLMQELETNVGVLVACLPAMHSPLRKLVDRCRGTGGSQATTPSPDVTPPPPVRRDSLFAFGFTLTVIGSATPSHTVERSPSIEPSHHDGVKLATKTLVTVETIGEKD